MPRNWPLNLLLKKSLCRLKAYYTVDKCLSAWLELWLAGLGQNRASGDGARSLHHAPFCSHGMLLVRGFMWPIPPINTPLPYESWTIKNLSGLVVGGSFWSRFMLRVSKTFLSLSDLSMPNQTQVSIDHQTGNEYSPTCSESNNCDSCAWERNYHEMLLLMAATVRKFLEAVFDSDEYFIPWALHVQPFYLSSMPFAVLISTSCQEVPCPLPPFKDFNSSSLPSYFLPWHTCVSMSPTCFASILFWLT